MLGGSFQVAGEIECRSYDPACSVEEGFEGFRVGSPELAVERGRIVEAASFGLGNVGEEPAPGLAQRLPAKLGACVEKKLPLRGGGVDSQLPNKRLGRGKVLGVGWPQERLAFPRSFRNRVILRSYLVIAQFVLMAHRAPIARCPNVLLLVDSGPAVGAGRGKEAGWKVDG